MSKPRFLGTPELCEWHMEQTEGPFQQVPGSPPAVVPTDDEDRCWICSLDSPWRRPQEEDAD